MNVWNFLADAAARHPDRIALRQEHRELSYTQARDQALALAAQLRRDGVVPGDRVACLMLNGIDHLVAYFAVAAAGATLVSLNTRLAGKEQRDILVHSGTRMLVHDEEHAARARELLLPTIPVSPEGSANLESTGQPDSAFAPTLADGDQPAQLYYTSGTTGSAKGVVLTHDNVCTHALAAIDELGLNDADTWAHIAPMFHLADAWATFAITAVAGNHAFLPEFTTDRALDLLESQAVTITNLVPTMLNLMVKKPGASKRNYALRVMLSGGAPIAPDVVRRILETFDCDYVQTYGMTETSPYLTLSLLSAELSKLPLDQQLLYKCKTGRAFQGIELRVVNDQGEPIANDGKQVGEIRVRGKTVTPGYWNNPEATSAAFDKHGFLMTGDLANIDEHGFVDIVDRKKDVIKTGGESVYSIEVEHALYEHTAVLECAVYGKPDEKWGERVVAAVVLRQGEHASETELIEFCRKFIAGYKTPKEIAFVESLPRTGSGKIQKRALRDS